MQKNKDRFLTMAEVFDKMAPYLVPQYDFLQESILAIIHFGENKSFTFVDLGGGSGIQIERVLKRYPRSRAVYVDSSAPFREVAERRLRRHKGRVNFIDSTLESDWERKINTRPELVFSMSAIHHLEPHEKMLIYKKANDILKPGGWFFNIDEMKSPDREAYRNSLLFWLRHVRNAVDVFPRNLAGYYKEWMRHFNGWKRRNIDGMDLPKVKGDDIHETYDAQLGYLREAGFRNADLFVKYHLWCVIGGQK